MTLIDELKVMNYSIIDCLKNKGASVRRNEIIKEILKDETCFFRINKDQAFVILKDLKVSDDKLEDTYQELTSRQEFSRLFNNGKINQNDKSLKISYKIYDDNIFINNNINQTALIEVKEDNLFMKIKRFLKVIFHIKEK